MAVLVFVIFFPEILDKIKSTLRGQLIASEEIWCDVKDRYQLLRELRSEIAITSGMDLVGYIVSIGFLRKAHVGVACVFKRGGVKQWCTFNPEKDAKIVLLSPLMDFEEINRWLGVKSISQSSERFVPLTKASKEENKNIESNAGVVESASS